MDDRWRKRYGRQLELATPKQWAALVPREVLEEVARESGGDQRDGKLPAPVHFWLLVAGALCGTCPSLASLIALFEKRFGFLQHSESADADKPWITPAAVSKRNRDRPLLFWMQMFVKLRELHFGGGWQRKVWQKKFAGIEALDSSTFRLMARLVKAFKPSGSGGPKAGSKNTRGALKLHQVYAVGEELPGPFSITPAAIHDCSAWRDVLNLGRKGVLYLFDRAYCDFDLWRAVVKAKSFFVTPLKEGMTFKTIGWLTKGKQVRDRLVRFPGLDVRGSCLALRLVEIRQEDGTWWGYVTNLADPTAFTPADITELYRLRWRIELFFRHLKHTLRMQHWFAESEAGVQAQLYAALIGYLLTHVLLLWASRNSGLPAERFRFATIVSLFAQELLSQFFNNQVRAPDDLLLRIRRNAVIPLSETQTP
jgi:IS4 transposase